jgi:hypothetical protein
MLSKDRERMVATQIEARGITDPLVLDAPPEGGSTCTSTS